MKRTERRLVRLLDEIAALREQLRLTTEELTIHQHLDDDARRDAVVGGPIEREDARITSSDVQRFQALSERLVDQLARLEAKRQSLIDKLG